MPTLASGPSTRNEGWLHRGTYHACSIADRDNALQVAARCIYGHEQLMSFCPEAIEGRDVRPIAMLRDGDRPDYEIVPERAANLRRGISRIFPDWRPNDAVDVACVKVDLVDDSEGARSLNIAIREPVANHIVALPGKLTETPYLTDMLVSRVHHGIEDGSISQRPCDAFAHREVSAA